MFESPNHINMQQPPSGNSKCDKPQSVTMFKSKSNEAKIENYFKNFNYQLKVIYKTAHKFFWRIRNFISDNRPIFYLIKDLNLSMKDVKGLIKKVRTRIDIDNNLIVYDVKEHLGRK
jgi:chromosome segregation ATPase